MASIVQIGIVCDKQIVGDHLLHHRMPSVLDIDKPFLVQFGTDIMIPLGCQRQRRIHIQPGHRPGRPLNPLQLHGNGIPDFTEQIVFQGRQLILGI